MLLHLDQCFQFEAVVWRQVGLVALNKGQKSLVPHDGHLSVGSTEIVLQISIELAGVAFNEFGEELAQGVDHLSGEGVFLAQECLQEVARAYVVIHLDKLHDGSCRVQVID